MHDSIDIFPWNDNFNTGLTEIDEQHKVLVSLINQLASHIGNESDLSLLDETFEELANYAVYHFQSEELIWGKFFPSDSSLKTHKETHHSFLSTVKELKKEELTKPLNVVIEDVLSFLTHWLAHHILDSDMRMSKVISYMKAGLSLESAQQKADRAMSGVMGTVLDTTLFMYDHLCNRTLELKKEINEKNKIEKQLLLISSVFDHTLDGICITDINHLIISTNPSFSQITGYSAEEVIGKNPKFLSSGKQDTEFYKDMWTSVNEKGFWQGEIWNRRKNGELYPELLTISPVIDKNKTLTHYIGLFRDISFSKKQQEQLELMAHYDVLTQLPNRILLADRFTRAVAHSNRTQTQLAICFLDLDNFKPVNDKYGHEVGDQLLVEVASRISINLREEDTVSRHGGDEFVLLLGDLHSFSQCAQMLDRLIHYLAQPYLINALSISISASIGVTLFPMDNTDLDTLMRHADQAMYQAKLAGRNQYSLFNTEQDLLVIQKHIQLQEIEKAISNNQLQLYYQPKVNMRTGEVFGAEALIRWNHPEKGLIPPLKFLPVIEATPLEITLGNWVINEALNQLKQWQDQGLEFEVSVNISSFHLQSPHFVADLETTLALYPTVDSKYLQLEILESSALSDLESIGNCIQSCINTLGVNIALDDFGTGYSSLTHLRNLAAKTIKIDQSFVRDLLDDPDDHAIIDGVIGLANSFNRYVIAEGVETTEHGLMLLMMGCDKVQGYGIAKPMPATDFKKWLKNYKPNQQWISCSNTTLSLKEQKIKLLKLTLKQWQYNFEEKIQSTIEQKKNWPIKKRTKCHSGIWLKRMEQQQLFDNDWLISLDRAHNSMHDIADDLFNLYHNGNSETARSKLKDIRLAFNKMHDLLDNMTNST